jgi:hypothetical protein
MQNRVVFPDRIISFPGLTVAIKGKLGTHPIFHFLFYFPPISLYFQIGIKGHGAEYGKGNKSDDTCYDKLTS